MAKCKALTGSVMKGLTVSGEQCKTFNIRDMGVGLL